MNRMLALKEIRDHHLDRLIDEFEALLGSVRKRMNTLEGQVHALWVAKNDKVEHDDDIKRKKDDHAEIQNGQHPLPAAVRVRDSPRRFRHRFGSLF